MLKAAVPFVGMLLLAAACGRDRNQPDVRGAEVDGFLGPVTYRYDPSLLTAANVLIAVPARQEEEVYAVKLLPARGVEGSPDLCPDGAQACPVEVQPGVTLALLERPFERYADAVRASELAPEAAPTEVAGAEGIAIDAGTEDGLKVEYRIIPVDNRALLIMRQRDHQNAGERQALDDVVASLDLGDGVTRDR
jgi:hypothetical protein